MRDGALGEVKRPPDGRVRLSLCEVSEHLLLAPRQPGLVRQRAAAGAARRALASPRAFA